MWSVFAEISNFINCRFRKSFFALMGSLYLLTACGGPPQFVDESSETPASLTITSDTTLEFPDRINGQASTHTLSITNLSIAVPAENITLTNNLTAPLSFSGGQFPGVNGTCSNTLAPQQICTIEIEINPVTSVNFQSSIELSYFDGLDDETFSIPLSGFSRDPYPASLTLSPQTDHDFSYLAIGGFADFNMSLTNSGELPATIVSLTGLNAPFTIVSSTCGPVLAAGSQCQWRVRFSPSTATVSTDTLDLDYFDGYQNQSQSRNFQGEGRVAGFITISEGLEFDYGIILADFNSHRTLTLTNTGGGQVTSLSTLTLPVPFSIVSNTCPANLNPTQNCQMVVRYSPTQTLNSTSNLQINYFDGFNTQQVTPTFNGQGFNNELDLILVAPASSPSNNSTPQIRVDNLITDIRVHLYQTTACGIQTSNQISPGSSSDFTPTMPEGTYNFHARVQDSDGNFSNCSLDFITFEYDNTPPNPPTQIVLSNTFTSSASITPTISWTASSSPDVVNYQVGIDTNPLGGNSISGFTSKGNVTNSTQSGLSLSECQYYYASVQSVDDAGLTSLSYNVSAIPFRYDSAPPTAPSQINEDGDASSSNSATITWTASSDACGISHYLVAVSEDSNGNNILDSGEVGNVIGFTNIGNTTSHRFDSLALNNGVAHFTSLRAVDTTGRVSATATSSPWIVYDPSIELPDMILWLDANDPSTIIDPSGNDGLDGTFNNQVQIWQDKSGSAVTHNFTAISSSTRPNYTPGNFSVDFNGSSTGMTTANHSEINTATVTQRNITVAFRTSADITNRQVLYEEGGNVRGMNIYIFNNRLYCGFYNDVGGADGDGDGNQPFVSVSRAISPNTTYFVTWVFDYSHFAGKDGPDGDLKCYVDSVNFASTVTTSRLHAHSGAVGLGVVNSQSVFEDGNVANNGNYFLGTIYEVMLFNNVPTDADVINVHTYLNNKWN